MSHLNFKYSIIIAATCLFHCISYSEKIDQLSKIVNALEDGFYSLAESECLKVINNSNNDEFIFLLSHAYCGQMKYPEVLALLSDIKKNGKSIYWQAYALKELKRYDEAIELLNNKKNYEEFVAERLHLKGQIFYEKGLLNDAENTFLLFNITYPAHKKKDENIFQLSRVYESQNRLEEAKEFLNNLVLLDDLDLSTRSKLLLSKILFDEDEKIEEAELFMNEIINNNQLSSDIRMMAVNQLTAYQIKNNKIKIAIKVFENAIGWANDNDRYMLKDSLVTLYIEESLLNDALRWINALQAEALSKEKAIELQFKKAEVFILLEMNKDAEFAYQIILDAANNNTFISEAYYGRGNALWNLGRSEEAAYMFSNAYKTSTSEKIKIRSLLKAGDAYYKSSLYSEAEDCYLKFINEYQDDINYPQALYQLGLSIARIGRRSDALNCFNEVCNKFPNDYYSIQARLRIADVLIAEKEWQKAIDSYLLVENSEPNIEIKAFSIMQRGLLLYRLGYHKDAQNLFIEIINNYPQSEQLLQAQYLNGFCLYMIGEVDRALEICQSFALDYPDSVWTPDVLFWLAQQAYNSENFDEAEILFLKIFDDYFTHRLAEQSLFRSAKSAMKQSSYKKAVERFNLLVRSFPKSKIIPETRFYQGDSLTELGEYARAILAYEEILKNFPENDIANLALGRIGDCQFSLASDQPSRYREALSKYQTLLERGILSHEFKMQCLYKAGRCEMKLGNIDQGFDYYMTVVYYFLDEKVEKSLSNLTWFTRSAFSAAELQLEINNVKGACAIYERVINADIPSSKEAERRYKILLSKNKIP